MLEKRKQKRSFANDIPYYSIYMELEKSNVRIVTFVSDDYAASIFRSANVIKNEHLFTLLHYYRANLSISYYYTTSLKKPCHSGMRNLTFKKTLLHFAEEKCSLRF